MIEGHGDDLFRHGDKVKVNFSTNIPQSVDHSGLLAHLARRGAVFKNYPEPEPRSVERKLADFHGISPDNIMVTNGATEAIYLLANAFYGRRSAIIVPTFREYQDACRIFNHSIRFTSSLNDLGSCNDMAWLCNPNNPTGKVFDRPRLLDAIDSHKDTLFVVDQAYAAYSVKDVLSIADVMCRENAVMLHSLTKQFVVPGLRIGYAIGAERVLNRLRSLRMPWSVNSIAIEAAHYLIDNRTKYQFDAAPLHAEACRMADALQGIGISVQATDCNFILAQLPDRIAAELKEWLIDRHGLLIRDASNFEGLSPRHFRVAAQSHDENELLINALKEWTSL